MLQPAWVVRESTMVCDLRQAALTRNASESHRPTPGCVLQPSRRQPFV